MSNDPASDDRGAGAPAGEASDGKASDSKASGRRTTIQATCVALDRDGARRGVLIRGAPGVGKSSLALRLIARGATLVADDLAALELIDGRPTARFVDDGPAGLRGVIEARGVGLMRLSALDSAPIALIVDLAPFSPRQRLPEPDSEPLLGVSISRISGADSGLFADIVFTLISSGELFDLSALEKIGFAPRED